MPWQATKPTSGTRHTASFIGGQLELLVSDALHGPKANWKQLPPLFTTNATKSGMKESPGAITGEFVTSGYFGGLSGDPDGGKTRVVTQNRAGPTYWVGKQVAGGQFEAYWDKVGAIGHYDYGTLTMARTLGSDPNQVAKNGRRVLVGWIGGTPASQSLSRDLTLSKDYELLQQFVPEYQTLRKPATFEQTAVTATDEETATSTAVAHSAGSLQMEVVATFSFTATPKAVFGISVLGGTAQVVVDCANTTVQNNGEAPGGCMVGVQDKSSTAGSDGTLAAAAAGGGKTTSGPLLPVGSKTVAVHIIVDHEILETLETIVNNRTAMVTYHKAIPSAASTAVTIIGDGTGSGVTGTIKSWSLDAANNAGPQP